MWPPKTPNEHFDRVPKNDAVNRRTKTRGVRGPRHLSCLGGAQLKEQKTKEISIAMPMTIRTVPDDISKSLKFYTLA